jgi:hypothetical protein
MQPTEKNRYALHIRGSIDRVAFQKEIENLFGAAVQICYEPHHSP